jgi:cytochrome P450
MQQGQKNCHAIQQRLINNATVLIVAGTETTATLLCRAMYYLLSNPPILRKLCQEIRGATNSASDFVLLLLRYMLEPLAYPLRLPWASE